MVAAPNIWGLSTTSINPIFLKILFKASPKGKFDADFDKYPYAFLSFEKTLPTSGNHKLQYNLYPCLKGNLVGTEVSKITKVPPGLKTLKISAKPFSSVSKFLIPKATVTTSKLLSSNGRFSESACRSSILSDKSLS